MGEADELAAEMGDLVRGAARILLDPLLKPTRVEAGSQRFAVVGYRVGKVLRFDVREVL